MKPRYSFAPGERLKRKQAIETLFQSGKAFSAFPLRAVYNLQKRDSTESLAIRAGVSAPKKIFRKAHHRNRVKRLIRESWRTRKHEILTGFPSDIQLHLFLLFTGKEMPDLETVNKAMSKVILTLKSIVLKTEHSSGE